MTTTPELPAMPEAVFTLDQVAAFLDGSAPLDGVWFGELNPNERGRYWWRKHLSAAMLAHGRAEGARDAERFAFLQRITAAQARAFFDDCTNPRIRAAAIDAAMSIALVPVGEVG